MNSKVPNRTSVAIWVEAHGMFLLKLVGGESAPHLREEFLEAFFESVEKFLKSTKRFIKDPAAQLSSQDLRRWLHLWAKFSDVHMKSIQADVLVRAVGLGLSLQYCANVMRKSCSWIRSQIIEKWVESAQLDHLPKHLQADCARLDLHWVEYLLNREWEHPLNSWTRKDMDKHLTHCVRCQNLQKIFKEQIRLEVAEVSATPGVDFMQDWNSWLEVSKETRWQPQLKFIVEKPMVKLLFQFACVAIIFFLVLHTKSLDRILAVSKSKKDELITAPKVAMPPPVSNEVTLPMSEGMKTSASTALPPAASPKLAIAAVTNPPAVVEQIKPIAKVAAAKPKKTRLFERWSTRSATPEEAAELLRPALERLGATVAGQLVLGAPYKGGRYFHFTIAQDKRAELEQEMTKAGLAEVSKNSMSGMKEISEDMLRVVLWVGPTDPKVRAP